MTTEAPTAVAAHEPAVVAGAPQPFLQSRLAEAASLALFAAGAIALTEAMWGMPRPQRSLVAVVGTLLGLLAAGIERGQHDRPAWPAAFGLSGVAAALHVALLAALASRATWLEGAIRAGVVLLAGAPTVRFGARLDRQEAGWREAVRCGHRHGASPLADAFALRPFPAPIRWAGLLLLPLDLALRAASLAAILLYQLTLSRLMPPACRYEPSCSRYGFQAYRHHGFVRASLLTAWRVLRCSPLGSGDTIQWSCRRRAPATPSAEATLEQVARTGPDPRRGGLRRRRGQRSTARAAPPAARPRLDRGARLAP